MMIRTRGLRQTFQSRKGREKVEVHAVASVDIDVAEGEVVGFLGPNGAGKITTLRMLTTLLRPTAGEATVAGYDVVTQSAEVRRRIGYVSQVGSTGSETRAGRRSSTTRCSTGCPVRMPRPMREPCSTSSNWTGFGTASAPRCRAASGVGSTW